MRARRPSLPRGVAHAARIALTASLLIGAVYAGCVVVLDRIVSARLVAAVDERLHERLSDAREIGRTALTRATDDDDRDDIDSPPLYLWLVTPQLRITGLNAGAPQLSPASLPDGRSALTTRLAPGTFRLDAARVGDALLVAGQSLAEQDHILGVLGDGEMLAAPVLLLAVFVGSLIIGLRARSPVEQSRRRQLEFTADASH